MTAPKRPASAGRKPAKPNPRSAARPAAKPSARPAARPAAVPTKPPAKAAAKPAAKPASKPGAKPPLKPAPLAGKPAPKAAVKPLPPPEPEKKPVPEKVPPRGQLVPRLYRALKANYKPFAPPLSRPLLEQVLLACCLENAPPEAAERAFTRLMEAYFDLNEVRVTTVAELGETLHDLPDPARAALSLRRVLQSVFESTYNFSLEHARKHSLAHGLRTLENLHGVPSFVVQYVTSTALGGHVIPLDRGALGALWLCGLITRQEYDAGKVPGLERLIGKKSGVEFAALLHQFGVDCLTNLHGTTVRKVALATNPAAKDRFPKRGEPLPEPVPPPPPTGREGQRAADAARTAAEEHRPAGPQAAARPAGKTPQPPAGSGPKRTDGKPGGKPGPKPFVVKPNVGKPLTIKPQVAAAVPPAPADAGRKPPPADKTAAKPGKSPPPPPKRPAARPARPADTRHSATLGKRKPR